MPVSNIQAMQVASESFLLNRPALRFLRSRGSSSGRFLELPLDAVLRPEDVPGREKGAMTGDGGSGGWCGCEGGECPEEVGTKTEGERKSPKSDGG